MIFDRYVTFHDKSNRKYDPKQHKYVGDDTKVVKLRANVTDLGTEKSVQLFGDYKHRALVIRLTKDPPEKWSYLTLDGDSKKYVLNTMRTPLKYYTLIVGESDG